MLRMVKQFAKVAVIAILWCFFPTIVSIFLICGLYDVLRNDERTPAVFERYFLGNGLPVWLLSPVNTLLDVLSLPYVNKGVYRLEDLPAGHRSEIVKLVDAARRQNLVGQLQQAAEGGTRRMFFFKWYGENVEGIVNVPEFHDAYKYIMTIGVSVFNEKQSTSKHFGPLRASIRVLYNLDDVVDDSAYIVVGRATNYWKNEKLFIFDDTLLHQSFNETDRARYNLFVDIVRPTTMPGVFKAFIRAIGKGMAQGANKVFYRRWKVLKTPAPL